MHECLCSQLGQAIVTISQAATRPSAKLLCSAARGVAAPHMVTDVSGRSVKLLQLLNAPRCIRHVLCLSRCTVSATRQPAAPCECGASSAASAYQDRQFSRHRARATPKLFMACAAPQECLICDRASLTSANYNCSTSPPSPAACPSLPGLARHPRCPEVLPGELEAAKGVARTVQHAHDRHGLPVHVQAERCVAHAQACRTTRQRRGSLDWLHAGLNYCCCFSPLWCHGQQGRE